MRDYIRIEENGLNVVFEKYNGHLRLLHFSVEPFDERNVLRSYTPMPWENEEELRDLMYPVVEWGILGEDQKAHYGEKHNGSGSAARLNLEKITDKTSADGERVFTVFLGDEALGVVYTMRFYKGLPAARITTSITNRAEQPLTLSYLSSFALTGLLPGGEKRWGERAMVTKVENSWCAECRVNRAPLAEMGLPDVGGTTGRVCCSGLGTWSSGTYLPEGLLYDNERKNCMFWQVEHCGSWHWEIGDDRGQLQLLISGPTEQESGWVKILQQGECFETVPVTVGCIAGDEGRALQALTACRRILHKEHPADKKLPVIFNDFMNLDGEPSTDKLIPLIDAAADLGCEYFVIDCGWYCEESWWEIGDWQPNGKRFPNGLEEPAAYIRDRGMIPGIWLEIEKVSVDNRMAAELPDKCFFSRHGRRVIANSRYQLDFSQQQVRDFADEIVRRLVEHYGFGYIKMDYNCNSGIGTDACADSAGDGLLRHNRAYLTWLDAVMGRYPKVIIENCGSGGMRLDYSLLSRHSIQSLTDQTDYRHVAVISANSAVALTPEQTGVWSYPSADGDAEETAMNMINAMLKRVHQSGFVTKLSPESLSLVKEGIEVYKKIRREIADGEPFWPIGFAKDGQPWISFGLQGKARCLLAVWRLGDVPELFLPLHGLHRKLLSARSIYPDKLPVELSLEEIGLRLTLEKKNSARLIEICLGESK